MKTALYLFSLCAVILTSCVTTMPPVAPGSVATQDDSRNFVMLMDGEVCYAEMDANNIYCENHHESRTITATVIVNWRESGQPRTENVTVSVLPGQKGLVGCEWKGQQFATFQIATSHY